MKQPIALLDACVLYPYHLRDFLIRLSIVGKLYQLRWTDIIHDEWTRNLLKNRPDLNKKDLRRTVKLMNDITEALIPMEKFSSLINKHNLPDPDDNHVLAAAIACNADFIVTFNLKDFPERVLGRASKKLKAIHPDDFVFGILKHSQESALLVMKNQISTLKNPPTTVIELRNILHSLGLKKSMELIFA